MALTQEIEFLVVLNETVVQLCALAACGVLAVLLSVLIFKLFGGFDDVA